MDCLGFDADFGLPGDDGLAFFFETCFFFKLRAFSEVDCREDFRFEGDADIVFFRALVFVRFAAVPFSASAGFTSTTSVSWRGQSVARRLPLEVSVMSFGVG